MTRKHVHSFIGMVNYYHDMWRHRSNILTPLTELTSFNTPWKWTYRYERAFQNIKKIISRETLLLYPNFLKLFEIHKDASNLQLGTVISQNNNPIVFYSRKLNLAQTRCTTTKK